MTNFSNIFQSILFSELRPWLPENINDKKFRLILVKLRPYRTDLQSYYKNLHVVLNGIYPNINCKSSMANVPLLKYEFPSYFEKLKPPIFYNSITEFYQCLIENECKRILAALFEKVRKLNNEIDTNYKVCKVLQSLQNYINQASKINKTDKQSTFVKTSLMINLFRLYNEIHFCFPGLSDVDLLSEDEIINLIVPDFDINKTNEKDISFSINQFFILRESEMSRTIKEPANITYSVNNEAEIPPFHLKKSDFREGYKGRLSYEDIVNIGLFTSFETLLYNNGFIDINYNFTNKHNFKKELAAIYTILIHKKYFREKNYKHQGKFRNADYRQYLDHRYNVDTSQQFRRSDTAYIKLVSDKYYWLDTLPTCR
jgi:hypothetical protein